MLFICVFYCFGSGFLFIIFSFKISSCCFLLELLLMNSKYISFWYWNKLKRKISKCLARIIIVKIKWNESHKEALELRIVEVHWCSQTAVNASTAGKVLTIASQCGSLWAIELHIELSRAIGFLFFYGSRSFFCACVLLASMARLILLPDSSCISHSSSAVRRQRSCARWRRNIVRCANLRIVCLSSSY